MTELRFWQDEPVTPPPALTFAFFDPFTLQQELLSCALSALADRGFQLLDARFVQYTQSSIETIYCNNQPIGPKKTWAIPGAVYLQDASFAVLLWHRDGDASEALSRFKGPADPGKRQPQQLRSVLAAPGRALSGMHSSDSAERVAREALTAFTPQELEALLAQPQPRQRARRSQRWERWALLGPNWRPSAVSFLLVLRRRIADELEVVHPLPPALLRLWDEAGELNGEEDYLRLLSTERAFLPQLQDLPPDLPSSFHFSLPVRALLTALHCLNDVAHFGRADVCALLRGSGVLRNQYERLLLAASYQELGRPIAGRSG